MALLLKQAVVERRSAPYRAPCSQDRCTPRTVQSQAGTGAFAAPRRQRWRPAAPCAFTEGLAGATAGGLVPGWLFRPDPSSWSTQRRRRQRQAVRDALAGCRGATSLRLPPPEGLLEALPSPAQQQQQLLDHQPAASNVVPFPVEGMLQRGGSGSVEPPPPPAPPEPLPRADAVQQLLPWLYAAAGYLDLRSIEHLASCQALTSLGQVDLSRLQPQWPPPGVCWPHSPPALGPAVSAAAALRRMACRQGMTTAASLAAGGADPSRAVLLVHHPSQGGLAAQALALFLHLYCAQELEEAAKAAGQALPSVGPPPLAPLRAQVNALAVAFAGWRQRVGLAWQYGAATHVDVVGDAVGSWDTRVPLVFDVARRQWRVQIWGMPPGCYKYKFIVDGSWVVDLAVPTETDAYGNVNNCVTVPEHVLTPAAAEAAAADATAEAAGDGGEGAEALALLSDEAAWDTVVEEGPSAPQPAELVAVASPEEQLRMARLGAALLALHARLPSKRRVPRHALP